MRFKSLELIIQDGAAAGRSMSLELTSKDLGETVTIKMIISIKTFRTTFGVPVVRGMQYDDGIHARLEQGWHRVFLQRLPAFEAAHGKVHPHPKMKYTFRAGIRMARNPKTGLKDAVPPDNSTILFDFYNGNRAEKRPHETIEDKICFGRVSNIGGRAWLEQTKTDFCVLPTLPRNFGHRFYTYTGPEYKADASLPLAKLKVKVNHLPAKRDLRAFKKFCDEKYMPELLDRTRLAFWSDPSRVPEEYDLTQGPVNSRSDANRKKYADILEELQKKRPSNASQREVLRAASKMRDRIVAVQGPPGAGKTRTLRDKVIALTKIGHKTLCVASSNVAVDTDVTAVVWISPEDRKHIKCLRLETDGAEKAQRLAKASYAQYTGQEGEADELPEYRGPEQAYDHPAIRNSLDKLCMDYASREEYAKKKLEELENVNEAYQAIQNFEDLKQSNVPNGVTLDYRIWEITESDRNQAEADYKVARDRLSSEEYQRLLSAGRFSVAMFDRSTRYRECVANYVSKSGKITRAERTALEDETDAMTERVLAETNILFTTASNCGGALLEESGTFEPTIIFCDEAGQISIPSLCVPLTTFKEWEGLFLFGDIQQLEPTALSGQFNEFIANAKVSPLALLATKGFDSYLLDEQYRMAPACSLFPRSQFYDNKGLKDSAKVKADNDVRRAVRTVSHDLGVAGDKGKGSEYFLTNVVYGCSRVEINGTSLVNHANAEAIIGMVDRLVRTKVVQASTIKILTYYQGQRRLIRQMINAGPWPQAIKDAIEISTVDSFQGREARVVIVDTVAAKDKLMGPLKTEQDVPEDAEDFGGEDYVKVGAVTGHVRNPNRLDVALTRGKDATIIFGQAALLASTLRKNRGKQSNALANMVADAKNRHCWADDFTEDMHPESIKVRVDMGKERIQRERESQEKPDLNFISVAKNSWQASRHQPAVGMPEPLNQYRVPGGHTTRPIGNPELVAKADAFDEEQRQIERATAESLITDAIQAENQLNLELGVRQSLDSSNFPALPRAKVVATSEQASALDVKPDDKNQGDADSDVSGELYSDPEAEGDEKEEEEDDDDDKVLAEYEGIRPGEEGDQFAD